MQGQRVDYIRVSTLEQNTQRQQEHVQVDRIFIDKALGKDIQRLQLDALLAFVCEGDFVVVVLLRMDRLA